MENITISEDQNIVTVDNVNHKFVSKKYCNTCTLFAKCCELQKSTDPETDFPFPCVERNDGDEGNFQSE